MNKKEKVLDLFHNNLNCAQSVLYIYGEDLGIDGNTLKAVACGFGGGIGMTQQICGAITGAIMVLGAKYFDGNNVAESKNNVYEKTKDLLNRFKEKNDSINCIDLIGTDISTDEGVKIAYEKNLFNLKCKKCLADVCDALEKLI